MRAGVKKKRTEYSGGNWALNSIGLQISDFRLQIENLQKFKICNLKSEIALRPAIPFHRRDALWNAGVAANPSGPLLERIPQPDSKSPLKMMSDEERLIADFRGTGMTVGPHPMAYHRVRMEKLFFFSSRRRHTRLTCDWSSDVCSSD